MPLEIDYYDINVHKLMLHDRIRCEAFRRVLTEIIKRDSVVLDIGAGTGLLSIFAAQAGARAVYAVERTETAEIARLVIADNGLADRISVFQDDMDHVELPEQVDLIVSEWLGGYGVDENLLPVIVRARDRWLKSGGTLIPDVVTSWMVPAYDDLLEQDAHFWEQRPYGVDLSAISERISRQLHCCRNNVKEEHLLADPQQMWETNSALITPERAEGVFKADMRFVCRRAGRFNALAAWFDAHLGEGVSLSNKPSDQYTHWGRWVFPVGKNLDVEEGEGIDVRFEVRPEGAGRSRAVWRVYIRDYSFAAEDLTHLTR